ncbi:MAG: hypothetical protein KAR05_01975 [Candidatus Omnitrophica bacterium]|nr:hypothetical protein [Candidatus Omnitrophota bacterium]
MEKNERLDYYLDAIGFCIMGAVSLGYAIFQVPFAESYIKLPFLNFPIFVGEWILAACLLLFFMKNKGRICIKNKWQTVGVVFFTFVLLKALCGYIQFGPLALRHSAMFYYVSFAVLGCSFYRKEFFNSRNSLALYFVIIFLFITGKFSERFLITLLVLGFILTQQIKQAKWRYTLLILLLLITPYGWLFNVSRTFILANIVAVIYVVSTMIIIAKVSRKLKCVIISVLFLLGCYGVIKARNIQMVRAIFDLQHVKEKFVLWDKVVQEYIDQYKMKDYGEVLVFNPDSLAQGPRAGSKNFYQGHGAELHGYSINPTLPGVTHRKTNLQKQSQPVEQFSSEMKKGSDGDEHPKVANLPLVKSYKVTRLEATTENAIFRLMIWRDMIDELMKGKPLFGFSFGKPFRSVSLEILWWASGEWQRDGWIAAHNSYLESIYRAGLVSVLLILAMVIQLMRITIHFIKLASYKGLLLCGILVNWMMAANFLLIFELPYTAIPVWGLFGVVFAYYKDSLKELPCAY